MYAALHEDRVVAVHDDLHVVNEFVEMQPNSNEFITAKLKNKKNKIAKYQELYLVICNGKYVPYNLYETMKDIVDCDNQDLIFCRETLFKILEDDNLSKKEREAIQKTISVIMKRMEDTGEIGLLTLMDIHDMDSRFRDMVNEE